MPRIFVVTRPDYGKKFCVYRNWRDVEAEFDGAEINDVINVLIGEMSEEELKALPDFEGW